MNLSDYGERYLPEDKFIEFCKDCEIDKVYSNLDIDLLLDFEKANLFLPDFIITRSRAFIEWDELIGKNTDDVPPSKFASFVNIIDSFKYWHHNNQLYHPFDEKRNSPHLRIPKKDKYVNKVYKIKIGERELEFRNLIRFYSYWHAYVLYDLVNSFSLKCFSKIYRNKKVKSYYNWNLIVRSFKNIGIPENPDNTLRDYNLWTKYFDFLSFFIQAIKNCHTTYFPNPSEQLKRYSLSNEDYDNFISQREQQITFNSSAKFEITENEVFNFLKFLTNKYFEFDNDHRDKLLISMKKDILYLLHFIKLKYNYELEYIYKKIGTVSAVWYRHPLEFIVEGKFALARERLYRGIKNEIEQQFKNTDITIDENAVERFIQYCKKNQFSTLYTAIYDVNWADRDYYSIINNMILLVINYERFLKSILKIDGKDSGTLHPIIQKYFSGSEILKYFPDSKIWKALTHTSSQELYLKIKNIDQFYSKFNNSFANIVMNISYIGVIRNYFAHYPNTISFFHLSPDDCFDKIMGAYWYAWFYAEKKYVNNL